MREKYTNGYDTPSLLYSYSAIDSLFGSASPSPTHLSSNPSLHPRQLTDQIQTHTQTRTQTNFETRVTLNTHPKPLTKLRPP
nr:MAG TPA: hypothetical protein [Caudoviricetes sp.]